MAAGLRAAALACHAQLPFFSVPRGDEAIYREVARRIAGGDLLGGTDVLLLSPLYFYLLGFTELLTGGADPAIRWVQIGLGVGTVWLVYRAVGELILRRGWALLAAGITACYGPFLLYEGLVLGATLAVFLHALWLWVMLRAMDSPTEGRRWAHVGLALGLCILSRPNATLLLLPVGLALWWSLPDGKGRARGLAIVGSLVLSLILALGVRNELAAGEFVTLPDHGGYNFYVGNGPGATGTFRLTDVHDRPFVLGEQRVEYHRVAEERAGRELTPAEADRFWYRASFDHMAARPATAARLLVEKLWLFWNGRELPNNYDHAFMRLVNPVLGAPLVQYAWICPLALLGTLWMAVGPSAKERVVAASIVCGCAAVVLFFVVGRYRLPVVPWLIVAATVAWAKLWELFETGQSARVAAAVGVLIFATGLAWAPKMPRAHDWEYLMMGYAYTQTDPPRTDEAIGAFERALAINPRNALAAKALEATVTR